MREREASEATVVLHPAAGDVLSFGPFRFDRANRLLSRDDEELSLPPRVLGILEHLVARPGSVVSKQALMDAVWKDAVVTETSLTEAVSQLRQVLSDDPQQPAYVQTVHRRGYRFVARVTLDGATVRGRTAAEPTASPLGDAHPLVSRPTLVRWVVGALVLGLGIAIGALVRRDEPRPAGRVTRATLPLGIADGAVLGPPPSLAMTPSGSTLVYTVVRGGRSQLYARALDRFDATALAGTEGGSQPFVSPDGQWIGFFADGKLKKVPVAGGAPVTLCDARAPLGASWGDDGTIVFTPEERAGLARVAATGGTPEPLTEPDSEKGELGHWWPEILPGGQSVVFTVWPAAGLDQARLATIPLRRGPHTPQVLVPGATFGRYAPGGHLVFLRKSRLMAARLDPRTAALLGPAVALFDGVTVDWFKGAAQLAFSATGSLAYLPGTHEVPAHTLVAVGREGRVEALPLPPRPFMNLDATRDGARVALTVHEGTGSDLWVADLEHRSLTRLTSEAHNIEPAFAPDGRRVAFASSRSGPMNLFAVDADGSGRVERLLVSPLNQYPDAFSPDGRFLTFIECHPETATDLWVLPLGEGGPPRPLLRTRFDEEASAFSPDGRFLAYESNETDRYEVYVSPFPAMSPKWPISTEGGFSPVWSRDGHDLYYEADGAVMAVPVTLTPSFRAGPPRRLVAEPGLLAMAPAPSGLFLLRSEEKAPAPPVHLVLDWFEELGRLAGATRARP